MADTKISALTSKATLDGTELVPIVDDPGGTPVSKKTTAQAIAALGGGTPIYAGKTSQTGTNNPSLTTLHNNSGLTLVATRDDVGQYTMQFSQEFVIDVNKTTVLFSGAKAGAVRMVVGDSNVITVTTTNTSNVAADAILSSTYFEVHFFQ